ncbi:flavin-containing monooxygenase [Streptomyces sp. WG-D5]
MTDNVRERYRVEREKRMRSARETITRFEGDLSRFLDDPHSPRLERESLDEDCDAVVIGAGFGGIQTAGRLKEAGLERVRLLDGAGDVGGVWYWNRYPGAQCDVDSYCYLPLLEETGYIPKEKYSYQPEIHAHAQRLAEYFDLYPLALFQTMATSLTWDKETARWTITTSRGDVLRARYVAFCTGAFSNPKLPALPGLSEFGGHSFHSTRWDYAYTGGSSTEPLTGLADKSVAILGTGATAVQIVPALGRSARKVYVFQRTPSTIGVRGNRPTDPDWVAGLQPGWQRERINNFSTLVAGGHADVDLVDDGWTRLYQSLMADPSYTALPPDQAAAVREAIDLSHMERIRTRIETVVSDPATAERLKPYYDYLCKRPCFHDQYLDTFNRPNVELVDTDGRGVEALYKDGVISNGQKYPVDCVIFATGFEGVGSYTEKVGVTITGRDGITLDQHWTDGVRTLHGVMVHGFPNLFLNLGAPDMQGAVSVNLTHILSGTAEHIGSIVSAARQRGAHAVEISREVEDEWAQIIEEGSAAFRRTFEKCTPGRLNDEGRIGMRSRRNGLFPGSAVAYFDRLRAWRVDQGYEGLTFDPVT